MSESNKIELSGIFEEGYGVIPKKLMKMDIHKNIKLLLAYMLSYTGGGKKSCFPSYTKIAKHLKMSKSTVSQNIKYCVEMGFIEINKNIDGFKKSNEYKLKILDPTFVYCTDDSTTLSTADSTQCSTATVHNEYSNNNNNNNIINNNSNGSNTVLFKKIRDIFYNVRKFTDYKKECGCITNIIKKGKITYPENYEMFIDRMIKMYAILIEKSNNAFWKKQPFTPAGLVCDSIWSRVERELNIKIKDNKIETEYREFAKELFK